MIPGKRFTARSAPAVFLAFTVAFSLSCSREPSRDSPSPGSVSEAPPPDLPPLRTPGSYADVVDRVAPAVVTVRSTRRVRAPRQHPFLDEPLLREFFGYSTPQREVPRVQGVGSGIIVSPDGYVLTNHHVIDGAEEVHVVLADRRTYRAQLVGSDPPSDLAVLKVDERDLPVLPMGNSDRARVGDVVLAIGNPLGLEQTVTAGIISAKGRSTGLSDGSFEDFLQTDAPINQGNSGGALVSTRGELIGINSQIVSPTGGNIGIGFAIPANMARDVRDQLVQNGRVRRGSLGVTIQPVTPEIAEDLGLRRLQGAVVASTLSGSPADRAGLRRGDVILAVDGRSIADPNVLRNAVAGTRPGREVTLTVRRGNRDREVRVRLGEAGNRVY